jgi:hypothetical protein
MGFERGKISGLGSMWPSRSSSFFMDIEFFF